MAPFPTSSLGSAQELSATRWSIIIVGETRARARSRSAPIGALGAGATPALVQRYCQLPLKPLPGRGSVSTWLAFSTARLIFS